MLSWSSWKLFSLTYFFSSPAPLCLVGYCPWLDPHFLIFLMVYPETLGFEPDLIFFIQILFWVFVPISSSSRFKVWLCTSMLVPVAHASPFSHMTQSLPHQSKTTPCIYFHHLFRNRVSLLQKISSQNLSVLPVSSQVSSVMVPAVSLDSLGPGLRQKLGGKDQESESGRGRGTKANT